MNRVQFVLRHSPTSADTRAVLVAALAACAALCGPANAQDRPASLLKPPITQWNQPPVPAPLPEAAPVQPSAAAQVPVAPQSAPKPAPVRVETLIRPAAPTPAQPSVATQSMPTSAPKPAPARMETLIRPATPAPAAPQRKPVTVRQAETVRAQAPAQPAQPTAAAPAAANTSAGAANKAPATATAPAVPGDFGAVARLLEFQASGAHAGPAQWISGRDASASYQRFLAGENDAAPAGKQQGVGDYGMQKQTIMPSAGVQAAPTGR